ncbi:D-alanyl-lipoteichoic acid biosynthesis protein DltD, partial [Bacillus velezensis]|uniref:D-alanyl-lipoteichoic acid biosynthesis protein DltD n=1 Tax=Bacillus velezensis TaxID=492670 RepID=UPI0024BE75E9
LKDAGAKPLFVFIPVNGYWYDYNGYPEERHQQYYDKMQQVLKADNVDYVDFTDHEYVP